MRVCISFLDAPWWAVRGTLSLSGNSRVLAATHSHNVPFIIDTGTSYITLPGELFHNTIAALLSGIYPQATPSSLSSLSSSEDICFFDNGVYQCHCEGYPVESKLNNLEIIIGT